MSFEDIEAKAKICLTCPRFQGWDIPCKDNVPALCVWCKGKDRF